MGDSSFRLYYDVTFLYVANPFSFSRPQFPYVKTQLVGENDLEWALPL